MITRITIRLKSKHRSTSNLWYNIMKPIEDHIKGLIGSYICKLELESFDIGVE